MSDQGRTWEERVKYSINIFDDACWDEVGCAEKPVEVQTLDECLLIIPRPVFRKLQFDEKLFDGWDCYGTDYCLSAKELGYKAYVIPISCSHSCLRGSYDLWEFKSLHKYQKITYKKHKKKYKIIYTFLGDISWRFLCWISLLSFLKPIYLKIFPNFQIILKKRL